MVYNPFNLNLEKTLMEYKNDPLRHYNPGGKDGFGNENDRMFVFTSGAFNGKEGRWELNGITYKIVEEDGKYLLIKDFSNKEGVLEGQLATSACYRELVKKRAKRLNKL